MPKFSVVDLQVSEHFLVTLGCVFELQNKSTVNSFTEGKSATERKFFLVLCKLIFNKEKILRHIVKP